MKKILLISVIYLIVVGAVWYYSKDWVSTQTVAIVLTGLIIIWYTYETRLLRSETQRQTEVQQRPFVLASFEDGKFKVSNFGYGAAINVTIKPVLIDEHDRIEIRFPQSVPILKTGESATINAESFKNEKSWGDFFFANLDPRYAKRK